MNGTKPEVESENPLDPQSGWSEPKPEAAARSTSFPAGMALGITLLLWGLVAPPVVLVSGAVVALGSLIGWIVEVRNER